MKNSLIITIAMALALNFSAKADYVFSWSVDESSIWYNYSYVAIAVKQASGDISYLMSAENTSSPSLYTKGSATPAVADVSAYFDNTGTYKASDYADYSYALVLINSEFSQVLATSYYYTLDSLLANAKVYETASAATQAGSVNTVNYNSLIPEPTSGLLLLIGGALLALKRKRN